jgi:histidine phosphotransfer protein HptB
MQKLPSAHGFLTLFTGHRGAGSSEQAPGPIRITPPAGLEGIVPGYLSTRREEVTMMTTLLAAGDFSALAVIGHNLKGNGSSYGFHEISRIGHQLMESATHQDSKALGAALAELRDYLARVSLVT